MPLMSAFESTAKFQKDWASWHDEASFSYADGQLSSMNIPCQDFIHFKHIFGILAGKELEIISCSSDWKETLVGIIRFAQPTVDTRHLSQIMNTIKQQTSYILLDQILLAILEIDILLILKYCSQYDWWLVTHLVDVFEMANIISPHMQSVLAEYGIENCTLSQWYRLSYADLIFSEPSLWLVTIEQLLHCGSAGRIMLEHVISHVPLDSELKNRNIVAFCETNSFIECKQTILCTLGKQAHESKRYDEALLYYLDAKKHGFIALIVKELLDSFIASGDTSFENVADNLSSAALHASPSLAFLSRYRDFQKMKESRQLLEAGNSLSDLITSSIAPKYFWATLLLDSASLLEDEDLIFDMTNTMELMRCAQEVTARHDSKVDVLEDIAFDNLVIVKLSLARNLARAVVAE